MNASEVKLTRKKDENGVYYVFEEGTKHLGKNLIIRKHYYYNVYNEEGKILTFHRDLYLRTLNDVKEWIANYDKHEDARLERENQEKEKREREAKERFERRTTNSKRYAEPTKHKFEIKVGDMLSAKMGVLSKPNSVGEVLEDTVVRPVKVIAVTEISNEEFDAMCLDFYDDFKPEWLTEHENGGTYSDSPLLEGKTWDDICKNDSLMRVFNETSYEIVHVITSPNRLPVFVNSEGFTYPRYAGVVVDFE